MTERRYLAHLRRGAATAITTADSRTAAGRFSSTVAMTVNGAPVSVPVTLYGPADVAGFAAGLVINRSPAPGAVGAEVNWFPQIDFAEADLPWRFTPVRPGGNDRLRPWCVLVVLAQRPGVGVVAVPSQRLPVVEAPIAELPDLDDADLWAHVEVSLPTPAPVSLADYLAANPRAAVARLLASRRMAPNTSYLACVVPAFEIGRVAGLGGEPASNTLAAAWTYAPDSTATVRLPVYDSWSFTTGAEADFESLARALQPAQIEPGAAERRFTVDPALGPGRTLPLRGALRPVERPPRPVEPVPPAVAEGLAQRINRAADLAEAGGAPVLATPLYASMQAARQRLWQPDTPGWLNAANTDPRNRIAAAAGGDLVQRHQESFVADAWRQVGQLGSTNRLLRGAQVARGVAGRLAERHLGALSDDILLQVAGPALARLPAVDGAPTVLENVINSAVPEAGFEGSFRRLTRARGPVLRRYGVSRPVPGTPVLFRQAMNKVDTPTWTAVDQGTVGRPSDWRNSGAAGISQRSDIHTPMPDPNQLPYLGTMFVTGPTTMKDMRFSTIIELRDNDAAGVVFRYRNENNYYRFSVDPERRLRRLVKCVNGVFTLLFQEAEQTATNEKHRIIVQVEGDRIQIRFGFAFTGQKLLVDLRDGSHPNGQVGLYSWANNDVRFTDISLEPQSGLSTADLAAAIVDQGNVDAPSAWTLEGGALRQARNIYTEPRDRNHLPKLGTFVRIGQPFWRDYEVEVTLAMEEDDDDIGVMLRVSSPTNYYRFSLDRERSYRRLVRCTDDQFTLLWQQEIGYPEKLFARFRLVADGPRLRGYIEGVRPEKLFDVRDRTHTHGGIGLYCWGAVGARFVDTEVREVRPQGIMGRLNAGMIGGVPIPPNGSLRMTALRKAAMTAVDPHASARSRVLDRVRRPTARTSADPLEPERPVVRFGQPLAPTLAAGNAELLLPGLSGIPDNAVVLLTPDNEFVASFLLGANTELARELAWRGLPTDLRGTAFRQFWDVRDSGSATPDIDDIATWPANRPLADQVTAHVPGSVFLIRSELVRRFPGMAVYLVEAVPSGASGSGRRRPGTVVSDPMFGGVLGPDAAYYGFAVPPAEVVGGGAGLGWYLVLEQRSGDGRFGLDLTGPATPATWADLAWTHLADRPYAHRTSLQVASPPGPVWARTGADMAAITAQQPVRLLLHADRLLPGGAP